VTLKAPYTKELWSTGETDSTIVVNSKGKYWVKITSGDCEVYDSVIVDMNDLKVELGTDKWFCEWDSLQVIPQITGIAKSYLWSNGSADSVLTVRNSGKVKLVVTNMKCHSADSVNILMKPLPAVILPGDTFYCNDEFLKLEPMNKGYSSYQWSTNETSSVILAKDSGLYWLRAGNNGCYGADTIHVSRVTGTKPELGIDTSFCGDFMIRLDGGVGHSYSWFPGGQKERFIYTREYDTYILFRTDMNGCVATDSIKITELCDPSVYVPTAFTPNKNGVNETFKPVLTDADEFQMLIYNRWGELVFETKNMDEGWDGTYNGRPVQQDVYAWVVYFKGKSKGSRKTLYGSVTL
ncbi:MAG: gliding motility-associated C-terminal domain-containing protein, partial [Bacteroidia bacterium]|nr:gliding motility-associated C-terminal domain-containing protein [Bacteroidia bacterium]